MQFFIPAIILLTAGAHAETQLDVGKRPGSLTDCVIPCVIKAFNNIKSCDKGLVTAACAVISTFEDNKEVQLCPQKCGVDASVSKSM